MAQQLQEQKVISDEELDAIYEASIVPVGQEIPTCTHREFARRIADRCAEIADEFTPPGDVDNAADAIRAAFAV